MRTREKRRKWSSKVQTTLIGRKTRSVDLTRGNLPARFLSSLRKITPDKVAYTNFRPTHCRHVGCFVFISSERSADREYRDGRIRQWQRTTAIFSNCSEKSSLLLSKAATGARYVRHGNRHPRSKIL